MRVARSALVVIALVVLVLPAPVSASPDAFQRTVATTETFMPLGLLLIQGTDTPLELAAFAGSLVLQTAPNVIMLLAEQRDLARATTVLRWTNFGIDCAIGAGALGVGIAYLAGAFGPGADLRMLGGLYLALSIPAAVAAFADTVPYAVESPAGTALGP